MFEKFTERARKVLSRARDEARRLKGDAIDTEHFLIALTLENRDPARSELSRLGLDPRHIHQEIERRMTSGGGVEDRGIPLPFSPRLKRVLVLAGEEADRRGEQVIGVDHLLIAVLAVGEGIAAQALTALGITASNARARMPGPGKAEAVPGAAAPLRPALLDQRSRYAWARAYPSLEDRPALQERVLEILKRGRSVALTGPTGVGKTSLVLALSRAKAGGFAWWMLDARLFDPSRLAEVERVLSAGTVCFVPGAEQLPHGQPAIETRHARLILEFRDDGFSKYAAANPGIAGHFDVVSVIAPDAREQEELLDAACARIRRERGVSVALSREAARMAREKWPQIVAPWGALAVLHRAEAIQRESSGRGDLDQLEGDIERLETSGDPAGVQQAQTLKDHVDGLRAMLRKELSIESIRQAISELAAERNAP